MLFLLELGTQLTTIMRFPSNTLIILSSCVVLLSAILFSVFLISVFFKGLFNVRTEVPVSIDKTTKPSRSFSSLFTFITPAVSPLMTQHTSTSTPMPTFILTPIGLQTTSMPTATPTPITSGPTPTPTPIPVRGENIPSPIRVLAIGYNPQENGQNAAETYFTSALGGKTASSVENDVFGKAGSAFAAFSGSTLQYTVVKKITISEFMPYPDGFRYTLDGYKKCVWGRPEFDGTSCESRKFSFDYVSWLNKYQICELAKQVNAHEIWMLSLPYVMTWESFMIGPTPGFDTNGPAFVIPGCSKHYVVINGTYDQPNNFLHDFGHRIEGTMKYLTALWTDTDRHTYWEQFAGMSLYSGNAPGKPYCGNAHFPSNTSKAYDYSNGARAISTCIDWLNFPNFSGVTESVNCSRWGCTDSGWQQYWFSFIPRAEGEIMLTARTGKVFSFKKNWWYYILFPDNAITARQSVQ